MVTTQGERLREERQRLSMSQEVFGSLASVTKHSVINYEKGERSPDGHFFAAIADAGADVLYILTGQRSQAVAEVELLPQDERVLIDTYRRCNADAKRNLIQTAALLSAGIKVSPHRSGSGVRASGASQIATGDNNIQMGSVGAKARVKNR